jgi:hypothetical protein
MMSDFRHNRVATSPGKYHATRAASRMLEILPADTHHQKNTAEQAPDK